MQASESDAERFQDDEAKGLCWMWFKSNQLHPTIFAFEKICTIKYNRRWRTDGNLNNPIFSEDETNRCVGKAERLLTSAP